MMGHNIGFKGGMLKIILKLSLLPLLIWSTASFFGALSVENQQNTFQPSSYLELPSKWCYLYVKLCVGLSILQVQDGTCYTIPA